MHEEMKVRLTGVAPLLMHNSRLADPLDEYAVALSQLTRKRMRTRADHERIAEVEFLGGLWLAQGRPCVPAEAIEAAVVQAAKSRRLGSIARAAVTVRESPALSYDGPKDLGALFRDGRFTFRRGVRIGARTTIRTRARFDEWSIVASFDFAPTMIDPANLRELVELAGATCGLGDWRPKFGRFRVGAA